LLTRWRCGCRKRQNNECICQSKADEEEDEVRRTTSSEELRVLLLFPLFTSALGRKERKKEIQHVSKAEKKRDPLPLRSQLAHSTNLCPRPWGHLDSVSEIYKHVHRIHLKRKLIKMIFTEGVDPAVPSCSVEAAFFAFSEGKEGCEAVCLIVVLVAVASVAVATCRIGDPGSCRNGLIWLID
jgi:hypothetical protein